MKPTSSVTGICTAVCSLSVVDQPLAHNVYQLARRQPVYPSHLSGYYYYYYCHYYYVKRPHNEQPVERIAANCYISCMHLARTRICTC